MLLLGACSKSLVVETAFPVAVVPALPLTVGVHYDEALTSYTHKESLPGDVSWTIAIGDANRQLFDGISQALFEDYRMVDTNGGQGEIFSGLDAVIEPVLKTFEFALPRQSRSDQYSVWMRFILNVYTPNGNLITSWPVSAYGQSDARTFGAKKSMEQAAIKALRDAFASIVIGFETEPKIKAALFPEDDQDEA
jgi:hypothetical protein